ncbi:LytTR family DNA-binding domain-containing protein [Pedobacter heparinus]|uniref:LytR/AlgR family response regulator transcription factor n=1 Tax=Pedobacter heparinus TaxID=984 RepID=UPI0029308611|nr:LytTR family DNA-binding domain-containing protein [Pedobacter heparinus]
MQRIRCLIVDDEPIARGLLVDYCSYLDILDVVAVCENAFQARECLMNHQVELIFLDINMPLLDGISFLKTVKNLPQVIFTTAYRKFAVTAFDLAACDYLVKPFSLARFIQAVDKVKMNLLPAKHEISNDIGNILVKAEGMTYQVKLDEIIFAEAKGNYTCFVLETRILKPKLALSEVEKLLAVGQFLRVHRSFIINREKISHIEGNSIHVEKHVIPLGASFREDFFKKMGGRSMD